MDLKLEVVVIPVSDVDRAKTFYERLGWPRSCANQTPHTNDARTRNRGRRKAREAKTGAEVPLVDQASRNVRRV